MDTVDRDRAGHDATQAEPSDFIAQENRFLQLFLSCQPRLLANCRRTIGNASDAEEVVQDTYVRAYENLRSFDGRNLPAWLSRIAQHLCIDRIRARSRAPLFAPASGRDCIAQFSEMRLITAAEIRTVLAKLPDSQRLCLKLFYIEGLTAKEVAETTGFTEKQVKSYLQNGRRNFIRHWQSLSAKRTRQRE